MSYKCLINLEGFFILWHNVVSINIPCGTILLLIWWTFTRELTFLKKKRIMKHILSSLYIKQIHEITFPQTDQN